MNSTIDPSEAMASPQAWIWAGLDVAKATFEAALWLPLEPGCTRSLREVPVKGFARTREGAAAFIAWAEQLASSGDELEEPAPPRIRAVMEATGRYSLELAAWLLIQRPTLGPAIINPKTAADFTASLALRNKTDKTDARALARYGVERCPACFEPPSQEHAELRELSRYRQELIGLRVAEQNRASEASASKLVAQLQHSNIGHFNRQIERIEKKMDQVLEKLPELKADAKTLDSIYGIGWISAVDIVAELGDLRHFGHGRQLTAFAGLSPRNFDSGQSVHKQPRMCKRGSSHVRRILFMPSLAVIRGDSDLADLYRRLLKAGKKKKSALGAVMRKLLTVMRAILISGKKYQSHFTKTCGKPVQNPVNIPEVST